MTDECCEDYLVVLSGLKSWLTVGYGFNNYYAIIWDVIYYTVPKTKQKRERKEGYM